MLLLLSLLGAAPLPPETDVPYSGSGIWRVGGREVRLEGQRLVAGTEILADRLYTAPVGDGAWLCAADEAEDVIGRLRCWGEGLRAVTIAEGGRPGRLALRSADPAGAPAPAVPASAMIAFVASPTGLPQVSVASADGRIAARALTNADLRYAPGQRPAGFVPPPTRQTLRFDGDWVRWEGAEGAQSVRWR